MVCLLLKFPGKISLGHRLMAYLFCYKPLFCKNLVNSIFLVPEDVCIRALAIFQEEVLLSEKQKSVSKIKSFKFYLCVLYANNLSNVFCKIVKRN